MKIVRKKRGKDVAVNSTNESGFSGLPGGYRSFNGTFFSIGNYGYWWSATQYSAMNAWGRYLAYHTATVYRKLYHKGSGFSVRCVRD